MFMRLMYVRARVRSRGRRCVAVPHECRAHSWAHERRVPSFSQPQMHPWLLCSAGAGPAAGGQMAGGRRGLRHNLRSAAL